jgi:SulP family sulfate permease
MGTSRLPIPLFADLERFGRQVVRSDLLAGLTTAVLLVPQSMAYALMAGLPPVTGLYAALMPPLGYVLVGSSRELSVGPTAIDSLLVLAALGGIAELPKEQYASAAALLCLMVGLLQLTMGALRLGHVVTLLSQPVLSGFTSAAALLIAFAQLPHLLGLPAVRDATLFGIVRELHPYFTAIHLPTLLLALGSGLILLAQVRHFPRAPGALVVIFLGSLVPLLVQGPFAEVSVVGPVPRGLPSFELPVFELSLAQRLLPSAITIAIVGFMESIAVGRFYAQRGRYLLQSDRELLALGVVNVLGGLFRGYPATGSFSRTAVNARAGARTTLSIAFASLIVGVSLLLFTPLFSYIPKAALAAIIVAAVLGLVDVAQVREKFRIQKSEGVILLITFAATVTLGVVAGLVLGIMSSLAWFLARATRPHIAVLGRVPGTLLFKDVKRNKNLITYDDVLIIRPDAQLFFANAEYLRDQLARLEGRAKRSLTAIIIDAGAIPSIDSTAADLLEELDTAYRARGVEFYLTGIKGPVRDILERTGYWERRREMLSCISVHEALLRHESRRDPRSFFPRPPSSAPRP